MKAKIYTRDEFVDLLEQEPMSYTMKRKRTMVGSKSEEVEMFDFYAPLDMRDNPDPDVAALIAQDRIGFAIAFNTSFGALARDFYNKEKQVDSLKKTIADMTRIPPDTDKEGRWEINWGDGYYPYCSECGTEPPYNIVKAYEFMLPPRCPRCGARMINYREFLPDDLKK